LRLDAIVTENVAVTVFAGEEESVAVNFSAKVPAFVGVPDTTPEDSVSPGARPVADQ
jgi:hypothetical protein